jgi:hypothetical protein
VAATRQIYEAAGWWNEHFGRVKTLAFWLVAVSALAFIGGGFVIARFGIVGAVAITFGVLLLLAAIVAFIVDSRMSRDQGGPKGGYRPGFLSELMELTEAEAAHAVQHQRSRIAAREIRAELRGILELLRTKLSVIEQGRAAVNERGFRLPASQWDRPREALDPDAHEATAAAYHEIERLNSEIKWNEGQTDEGQKIGFGPSHDLPRAVAAIEPALLALGEPPREDDPTQITPEIERATKRSYAKNQLPYSLDKGGQLRKLIGDSTGAGHPVGEWVPQIDGWISETREQLDEYAPEWGPYFATDTGDYPEAYPAGGALEERKAQEAINKRHLARLDRHLERLKEIIFERL